MAEPATTGRPPVSYGWLTVAIIGAILGIGPMAVLLALGTFSLPVQVAWLLVEPLHDEGPWWVISAVLTGVVGMSILIYVLAMLVMNRPIRRAIPVLGAVAVGVVAIAQFGAGADVSGKVIAGLALLSTIHILWLAWPLMCAPTKQLPERPDARDIVCLVVLAIVGATPFIRPSFGLTSEQLLQQRARWAELRPDEYEFELWTSGSNLSRELLVPRKIHVRGTEVVSIAPASNSLLPQLPTSRWTMDTLFDALIDAQRRGQRVRALFDEAGYIDKARIETANRREGWELEVRGFRVRQTAATRVPPAQQAGFAAQSSR